MTVERNQSDWVGKVLQCIVFCFFLKDEQVGRRLVPQTPRPNPNSEQPHRYEREFHWEVV